MTVFLNFSWGTLGEARIEETHLQEEGVAEKRARAEKSDTETEAEGEAGTSQS